MVEKKVRHHVRQEAVGATHQTIDFVLDVSGSMAGKPLADCVASITDIFGDLHPRRDGVMLTTFASSISSVCSLTAASPRSTFRPALQSLRASGLTVLWDAVIHSIDSAQALARQDAKTKLGTKTKRKIVLLTDGADSGSRASFEDACAKLAKPGCVVHVIIIAVAVDSTTRQQLEQLCQPKHAQLHFVDDRDRIKEAFAKFKTQLVRHTTVTEVKTITSKRVTQQRTAVAHRPAAKDVKDAKHGGFTAQHLRQQREIKAKVAAAATRECLICVDREKDCTLSCGHRLCMQCAGALTTCPFCQSPITSRIRTFD